MAQTRTNFLYLLQIMYIRINRDQHDLLSMFIGPCIIVINEE